MDSLKRNTSLILGLLIAVQSLCIVPSESSISVDNQDYLTLFFKVLAQTDLIDSNKENKGETIDKDDKGEEVKASHESLQKVFIAQINSDNTHYRTSSTKAPHLKIQAPPPKIS